MIDNETTPWLQQQVLSFMRTTAQDAIERNAWDEEPPKLWLLAKMNKPLGFPDMAIAQMPIPDILWDVDRPPAVVAALAHSCRVSPRPLLTAEARADLYGVIMLSETWDLDIPEDATKQERNEAHDFCRRRGIADHPWGVEAKTTFARDIDGWDMFISRRRGGKSGPEWISPPGGNAASGQVPDALSELLDALR